MTWNARAASGRRVDSHSWAQAAAQLSGEVLGRAGVEAVAEVVGHDDRVRAAGGDHRLGGVEDRAGGGAVAPQRQVRPGLVHLEGRLEGAQQAGDRAVLGAELDQVLGGVARGDVEGGPDRFQDLGEGLP